ncbi:MAG: serine/threonine protein kinase [Nannocystis sp.]|nr:serine/threonine protein kinase [Nannocystis sp.]
MTRRTQAEDVLGATVLAEETLVQSTGGSSSEMRGGVDVERGGVIGRYTVLDRIGAGAMGVVYTAYDPKLDRRIALKLMKVPADDGSLVSARLLREAQALAKLSHPNVVAVHDADSIGGEIVYLAMELVEGVSLTKWLKRQPRGREEVLGVFVQAGRGLAAAHAAGLVHRDFKPDNVLVGDDGRVRVVDFGIARNADEDPLAGPSTVGRLVERSQLESGIELSGARLTQTGAVVGTPAYMSPEQHLGTRVDGRCDMFAFCVALYEALYGCHPFPARSYVELRAAVLSGKVRPPSGADVPPHLRAALLRGLAVLPDRRFATMDALLAVLEDDPVRRRRWVAGSVGLGVVFAAIVGLAVHKISAAPPPCEGAARHLVGVWDPQVKEAVAQAFLATDQPYAAKAWESSAAAMDAYAGAWVAMRTAACVATEVHHEQSPEAMDLRMACLDRKLRRLSATAQIFKEADAEIVLRAVEAASGLPELEECANLEALGRGEPVARGAARVALDRLEDALARATALQTTGRYREGLAAAEEAVAQARALASRRGEARALLAAANAIDELGGSGEAVARLDEAARIAEAIGDDGLRAEIWSYEGFIVGIGLSRASEGERLLRHTTAVLGRSQASPVDQARNESRLAALVAAQARYDEALTLLRSATATLRRAQGDTSTVLMSTLNILGSVYDSAGDLEAARRHYIEALAIAELQLGGEHPETAKIINNIAIIDKSAGDFESARRGYQRALAIRSRVHGRSHRDVAQSLFNLGNLLAANGHYEQALRHQEEALAIIREVAPDDVKEIGRLLYNIGVTYHVQGRFAAAVERYAEALPLTESVFGGDHPETAFPLTGLGTGLVELGRAEEARALLERALAIRTRRDVTPIDLGEIRFALARALPIAERARARELAQAARADYEANADQAMAGVIAAWLASRE